MATLRPAPPPPAPKPGHVVVVRAMYRYEAQQPDELSFDEGDVLYIIDRTDKNWWRASCAGRNGLVPSNYVEENMEAVQHPLHEASRRGNLSFMNECIGNRVSVNGLDKAACTALHWAAHSGHSECIRTLLSQPGCQLDVQNKLGDTPLHNAAWKGHVEATKLLLEQGARPDLRNKEGKTPLDLASDPEVASLLKVAVAGATLFEEGHNEYGDEEDSD